MTLAKCSRATRALRVKVEAKRKKAVFLNPQRAEFVRVEFDGCVQMSGARADWVVRRLDIGEVIVELKGRDVEHALRQIFATAEYLRDHGLINGRIAGLVVAKQYPKETTIVQRRRDAFNKAFKGPVHVVTKNEEFEFERVLSFRGPR